MSGALLALILGLSMPVAVQATDPPDKDKAKTKRKAKPPEHASFGSASVFDRMFAPAPKPQPKKTAARSEKEPAEKKATVAAKPSAADELTAERDREEKAYLRRLGVCLKLYEIAEQTNDEELQRKAHELEQRIWAVYAQRTSHLPAGDVEPDADEQAVEKRLRSPKPNGLKLGDALLRDKNQDRNGLAVSREVNP